MSVQLEESKLSDSFQTAAENDKALDPRKRGRGTDLYYEHLQLDSSFDEQKKKRTYVGSDEASGLIQQSKKIKYASTGSSQNFGLGYTPGSQATKSTFSKRPKSKERKRSVSRGHVEESKQQVPYKRYMIFGIANPRSGDGLASGFLTDFPQVNNNRIQLDESRQTVDCEMRFYNVLEKQERETCLRAIANAFEDNDNSTRKVICIMGGDGSLAKTIQYLRTSQIVDQALQKGKLSFCMLPFGTGNDGAQVFNWGASPANELWL